MKKQLLLITLTLLTTYSQLLKGQSSSYNYHRVVTATSENGTGLSKDIYYNQHGLLEEEISHGIGPNKQDWITYTSYNSTFQISKVWLPYISKTYVNSKFPPPQAWLSGKDYYSAKEYPYTLQTYENSPLRRPIQAFGPGSPWHTNNKAVETLQGGNGPEHPCRIFTSTDQRGVVNIQTTGLYPDGELSVVRTKDEDGKCQYTFTNKQGQTVMTRQTYHTDTLDTYSVYDNYGNLRAVLPPSATVSLSIDSICTEAHQTLQKYAYLYKYDYRNRCIAKKLPGCDWLTYIYDQGDRLIFTQDGEQRKKKEFGIQFSDPFGRTVIKGTYRGNINSTNYVNQQIYAELTPDSINTCYGYTLHGLSIENIDVTHVDYYDTYAYKSCNPGFTPELDYVADSLYDKRNGNDSEQLTFRGLLTGSMISILGNKQKLYSSHYYDFRKRPIQIRSKLLDNHTVVMKSTFGFTGETIDCQEEYDNTTILRKHFTYDHANRLKEELQTTTGMDTIRFSYVYDDLGRLKETTRSNKTHSFTTRQTYNIRNWLTSISDPQFSQTLHYTDSIGTPCYNGNISAMTWCTDSITTRGYTFAYDDLNRMINALYGEGSNLDTNTGHFNEQITGYDKQGNILGLKRHGQTSETEFGVIDSLTFSYNGNQLQAVNDSVITPAYANGFEFKDGAKLETEYVYDTNGNLTQDLNKKITDIQYNCLNLPNRIQFEDGNSISYLYDADGMKLRTIHIIDGDTLTTDYCDNAIYENGILDKLLTNQGFITLSDTVYHYFLQDYQRNNRVIAGQKGNIEEVNHYYPLGGIFANSSSIQPYKYNGKELDRKNGLDWYDYGARMYDANIGRWHTVDPMSEKYFGISPYAYCMNNPIKFIDPNGKWVVGTDGKRVTYNTQTGWSKNASKDVQRVGNSLLKTETGTKQLNSMLGYNEKISITVSSDVKKNGKIFTMGINNRKKVKETKDGKVTVEEHQITIYEGSIQEAIKEKSGVKDYAGLDLEDAIGAVAGHESGHTEKENTKQALENSNDQTTTKHDLEKRPNEIEKKIIDELNKK